MGYEILSNEEININGVNFFCFSKNVGCIDSVCANVDCSCGGSGNSFPCTNPGFGCRNGCGGASSSMCAAPKIISSGR